MFKTACDKQREYIANVRIIKRKYKKADIDTSIATLFFINGDGWALTCKHVIDAIIEANNLHLNYLSFKNELHQSNDDLETLEKKYHLKDNEYCDASVLYDGIPFSFVNGPLSEKYFWSNVYDIGLIQFSNLKGNSSCIFREKTVDLDQGRTVCKIGFPFPEYKNYDYNIITDELQWTKTNGRTPCFANDGIITRKLGNMDGTVFGYEMSSPGYGGMSGGPWFDDQGLVLGLQSQTYSSWMFFGPVKLNINGDEKIEYPVDHLARCISYEIIKPFLIQNNVTFREE